jgi:hypothetical protein
MRVLVPLLVVMLVLGARAVRRTAVIVVAMLRARLATDAATSVVQGTVTARR